MIACDGKHKQKQNTVTNENYYLKRKLKLILGNTIIIIIIIYLPIDMTEAYAF